MPAFDLLPFLQIAFYLILILYTLFSVVLFYHWQSYSISRTVTIQTYVAYAITSFPLIAIMALVLFG